jgi:hypothetical protein
MVATGVRIAEVLMEKLPDIFQTFFVKVLSIYLHSLRFFFVMTCSISLDIMQCSP